jgi:oligopeptide/dipeptide ABC transporter ATP-binding protein
MYLGRIVELGPVDTVFADPRHPYTRLLLSAVPVPRPHARQAVIRLGGDPPSPLNPPPGCHFHTRCPLATERCRSEPPELQSRGDGRFSACHHAERVPEMARNAPAAPVHA